jgi:hypothetical protein
MYTRAELHDMAQKGTTESVRAYMQTYSLSVREAAHRFDMKPSTLHNRLESGSSWSVTDILYVSQVLNIALMPDVVE